MPNGTGTVVYSNTNFGAAWARWNIPTSAHKIKNEQ